MKAELVWYTNNSDETNYVYLLCPNCSYFTEKGTLCVRIPRPTTPRPAIWCYVKTNCPKCNADIGMIVKDLNDR